MKGLKNIFTVLGVAAATMALALALLAPGSAGAIDQGALRPLIAQPTLTANGCTFTLEPGESADGKVSLKLTAANPTDKPLDASAWLRLSASQKTPPTSRMMLPPRQVWVDKCVASLGPGETKTFTFTPGVQPTGAGPMIATMSDGNRTTFTVSLNNFQRVARQARGGQTTQIER